MKNVLVLLLIFGLFSCETNQVLDIQDDVSQTQENFFEKSNNNNYEVECEGDCDCGLRGVLGSHVECKCNDCVMVVKYSVNGEIITYELKDTELEVDFVKEYLEHMDNTYPNKEYTITKIEVSSEGADVAVLFYYEVDGNEDTIMFARTNGNTYKIVCDGSCGCKERFNFKNESAECTCDDCTMTVTKS